MTATTTDPAYLHGIPGLTEQRLGELWMGTLRVTNDPKSRCSIRYRAEGGIDLVIRWTQNGAEHVHEASIEKQEAEERMSLPDADRFFVEFVTFELDVVHHKVKLIADGKVPIVTARPPTFAERAQAAADTLLSMVGMRRSGQ